MNIYSKYRKYEGVTVAVGIILAMSVLFTQGLVYQLNEDVSVDYQLEQDQEEEGDVTYISQDAISVSTIQLNIDKPFKVVSELILPQDDSPQTKPESLALCLKFFKKLFRLTISPNAP